MIIQNELSEEKQFMQKILGGKDVYNYDVECQV